MSERREDPERTEEADRREQRICSRLRSAGLAMALVGLPIGWEVPFLLPRILGFLLSAAGVALALYAPLFARWWR